MHENEVARHIVESAFRVHCALGPGLFESVYETALKYELRKLELEVLHQVSIPVIYEECRMETGFRADLIVAGKVIVEIKSIETLSPVHKKQVLTFLRLSGLRLGLLINFNVVLIRSGIVRIVNGLE